MASALRKRRTLRICFSMCFLLICCRDVLPQGRGTLTGRVTDPFHAVIVGAVVRVTASDGSDRQSVTDANGRFAMRNLPAGSHTLQVRATGFQVLEQKEVQVVPGTARELDLRLVVGIERHEVTVEDSHSLNTDASNNRSTLVLGQSALDVLSDDPAELATALRALAGVPVGPNGGQILIDGFLNTEQPMPPRSAIREVRINQNPFSAENDRLGFGQIQVTTQPGSGKIRGQAFVNFNDESLNARNPFASGRPPYQMRSFGGNLGGPLITRRVSFFFALDHRQTDDNALINAVIPTSDLTATKKLTQTVLVHRKQTSLSARFDVEITPNHTLIARYNFYQNRSQNAGVGGLALPERAFTFCLPIHTFQLTDILVIGKQLINEFRLQYIGEDQVNEPVSLRPATNVLGSFISGGSNLGRSSNPEGRSSVQNALLWSLGSHTLRMGGRLRRTTIVDISPDDFNGTFVFGGGLAPAINAGGIPITDSQGQIISTSITSIERYRRTLLFNELNLSPAEIRARGGGANQLILGIGNPRATASQLDFGAYVQDDWRLSPHFTVSLGLRTDVQSNITPNLNLAPRLAFAWGLQTGKANQPKTVIRGGIGIFFDRFPENQVLVANKFGTGGTQRLVIVDPAILDLYPNLPSLAALGGTNIESQTVFRIADDVREPYMLQAAIGLERQLPRKTTLTVTYIGARTIHALRTRNINAPVILRDSNGQIVQRFRPNGEIGNIFQYESSGRLNQNQLFVTVNNRLTPQFSFFANYVLNKAMGDTDGIGTTPADSYDLTSEYGRSSFDVRHTFSAGANFDGPAGLQFSPLVFASSGRPFNITTGTDLNQDSVFTDRPSLASDLTKPSVRITPFGVFDSAPDPGVSPVKRNLGSGEAYFIVNINVSRTFAFSHTKARTNQQQSSTGATNEARYRLTLAVRALNLFNRANFDLPSGNLNSPLFGQATATAGGFGAASVGNPAAGNRRVETMVRLEF